MLAIKNARLIDGTGAGPVDGITILIEKGRFKEIGRGIEIPTKATVIDVAGMTVIPALSDAHCHFSGSSKFEHPAMSHRLESYDFTEAREGFLHWGVTTVRTMGDFPEEIMPYRNQVTMGMIPNSPRVLAAGPWFQARGGHPCYTVYMSNQEIEKNACILVDEHTDVEAEVSRLVGLGVDHVKVFFAHLNKLDMEHFVPRLTEAQLKDIVDTAHKYKKAVTVHVDGVCEMQTAAKLGVDCIEHLIGAGSDDADYSQEAVLTAKENGVTVDPTMISVKNWDPVPGRKSVWVQLKKAVKMLYDAGVPIAVGCDSGIPFVPFGVTVHDEMACLVEAGIPPLDVITMATSGNAKLFKMDTQIGSVEVGKEADLIVLGRDPLENIENTKDIKLVLMRGRVIRDEMLSL